MASILHVPKYYEPCPRFNHRTTPIGDRFYMWGGRTEDFGESSKRKLASVVEIYDPYIESWEQHTTTGVPPNGLYSGGCTSLNESLLWYGGHDDKSYFSTLHQLNTVTLNWDELYLGNIPQGPMAKMNCGLVSFEGNKLGLFGGYGLPTGPTQPGSTFIKDNGIYSDGDGWTNEFHFLRLQEGLWSCPHTTSTGNRPPPCTAFSFTAIDSHRAVLYGGYNPEHGRMNDVYIIDIQTMHWSKLDKCGGDSWPVGRTGHAACCLNYGEEHPQLLVSGGVDDNVNTLKDLWVLDVEAGTWRELALPEHVQPRWGHTATAVNIIPNLVEVMRFGGSPKYVLGGSDRQQPKMAETTVLRLESIESQEFGLQSTSREWVVADVAMVSLANCSQLGSSKRIREKMQQRTTAAQQRASHNKERAALQESQEREKSLLATLQESHEREKTLLAMVTTLNQRVTVAEKRADQAEKQMEDMQKLQESQTLVTGRPHIIGSKQNSYQNTKHKRRRTEVKNEETQSTMEDHTSHSTHSMCTHEAEKPGQVMETPLDDGDMVEVTDHLIDLEKKHIYHLGVVLGISQRKVKAMEEESRMFLDDVITAWLRREDQVERRGMPSWGTLVRALRHQRVRQNGIASKILRDRMQ